MITVTEFNPDFSAAFTFKVNELPEVLDVLAIVNDLHALPENDFIVLSAPDSLCAQDPEFPQYYEGLGQLISLRTQKVLARFAYTNYPFENDPRD